LRWTVESRRAIEIIGFAHDAIHGLPCLTAARGGGTTVETLQIKRAPAIGPPDNGWPSGQFAPTTSIIVTA